jgi:hypothetical protein
MVPTQMTLAFTMSTRSPRPRWSTESRFSRQWSLVALLTLPLQAPMLEVRSFCYPSQLSSDA